MPTGETRFEVAAAGLSFRSTAHEWLIIEGAKVRYEGVGTINGAGDYGFRLTAVDGGKRKGGDRFRIEIWDRALGNVVYDSEPGRAADDAPATALGGGSIVVHSGK